MPRLRKSRRRLALLRKPVLRPGISRVRIAPHLPEAEDVAVQKSNLADEFRPFPGVTFGDDDANRTPVFDGQRLAIPLMCQQNVLIKADLQWIVCRIPV